ncbi:uncharacterized protein UV8b_06394 [Ustilaginoidea virens]|uniref:Uncharacterized protein n=1 Tax=Ustilaginoidea virens TaxID=1159556 RepID=A0A063CC42_USTVR|nr:uncharacterized protein UV8b_06394 [Ustilaginoidea virens]QUC22153.1 hypothetical protein UV8b_06394 [Ustilaginoidea virens]GAO16431.1 hypothetical protein UVI_02047920 [Ustilaginoidea virens]
MASSPKARDPLDALQLLVNDVLVHTGKALRASRRDGQGNLPPSPPQAKLPDTIKDFHSALDNLENGIIRAKSVLLRDMDQLRIHKHACQQSHISQPHPVQAQPNSPVTIELDSSPQASLKRETMETSAVASKPIAPFPDMGMPESTSSAVIIKEETPPSRAADTRPEGGTSSTVQPNGKPLTPAAPASAADPRMEEKQPALTGGNDGPVTANSDLNFTDMEFSLAPGSDNQTQPGAGAVAVAPSGPGEAPLEVVAYGAANVGMQRGSSTTTKAQQSTATDPPAVPPTARADTLTEAQASAQGRKQKELHRPEPAHAFTGGGQTDGMDFDFSLDNDGMGGDTFDDLMNDRDNTFDPMEHGDYDANYYFDKSDEA